MAVDFHTQVYLPVFETFARPAIFTPQGGSTFTERGVFDTREVDVLGQDGAIISDQVTILDILDAEFTVMPKQLDRVTIPAVGNIPAAGEFEIMDADSNGGGMTTLTLRRIEVDVL